MKTLVLSILDMIQNSRRQNGIVKIGANLGGLMVGILLVLLVGCDSRDSVDEVRSVEWYKTYETERNNKLAECRADPALLDSEPECINASLAENIVQDATKWHEESDQDEIRTEPLIIQ